MRIYNVALSTPFLSAFTSVPETSAYVVRVTVSVFLNRKVSLLKSGRLLSTHHQYNLITTSTTVQVNLLCGYKHIRHTLQ